MTNCAKYLPVYSFFFIIFTFFIEIVISPNLGLRGNLDVFIELSKLVHRKRLKIFEFYLITLVGICKFWESLFPFKFEISFPMSVSLTSTKMKLEAYLYLLLIAIMLECFLYFKILFRFRSSIFHIKGSESGNREMFRFWTKFERNVLKTLSVSTSLFKISPFSGKIDYFPKTLIICYVFLI